MNNRPEQLLVFVEDFARRVEEYLRAHKMRQFVLGHEIGWSSGAVNAALRRPREKCSEKFVRDVGAAIPEFADDFAEYRRIEGEALGVPAEESRHVPRQQALVYAERFRRLAEEALAAAAELEATPDDTE